MPYIAIKAYPKDKEIKKRVAERINQVFLEEWGCPPQAISISFEEVAPEKWEDTVHKPEILTKTDKMFILDGQKKFLFYFKNKKRCCLLQQHHIQSG